jgi:D-alanyl-D-alanine carboxypeptidase (penicillin-binding protein 5/6)
MTRALLAALAAMALVLASARQAMAAEHPAPRAASAILVQPETGDVVYAKNADRERPIASTTKLMTALLTLERSSLDDVVPAAPYDPLPAESVINLRAGERMTVRDLLRGLLLASANDAAVTLADHVSGSTPAFVKLMNRRARQLGLKHTHYANPVGLDAPGNYSTARDLSVLAQALLRKPFFAKTVNRPAARLATGSHTRRILNRNLLVRQVPFVDGVKTGHTIQAGYVLVGAGTRNGVMLVSAVLGEPSEAARDTETLSLLRYGLRRYRNVVAVRDGQRLASAKLKYRDEHVPLVAARTVRQVVRKGSRPRIRVEGVPSEINGPLAARSRVGTVVVRSNGAEVARVPLVTARAVTEATLEDKAGSFFTRAGTLVLVGVLVLSTLQLARMRRRAVRRRERSRRRGTEAA